jgi:hypothetical protein
MASGLTLTDPRGLARRRERACPDDHRTFVFLTSLLAERATRELAKEDELLEEQCPVMNLRRSTRLKT